MKQTLKLAALVIIAAVIATSCGNKAKDMLVNKWTWSNVSSPEFDKKIKEAQAAMDTITDSTQLSIAKASLGMMTGMMDVMKGTKMEFTKDGKYTIEMSFMGQTKTEGGTYTLSDDGKTITMKDEKGKDTQSPINISKDTVVLTIKNADGDMVITMDHSK